MSESSEPKHEPGELPGLPYRVDSMIYRRLEEQFGRDLSKLSDGDLATYKGYVDMCVVDLNVRKGRPDVNDPKVVEELAALLEERHTKPVNEELAKRMNTV